MGTIPAHFLINEDGVIEGAFYGKTIADPIPWSEVKKFVEQIT